jgi:hypothetical protein
MARKRSTDEVATTTEHGSNSEGLVPYEIQRLKMYVRIQLYVYNGCITGFFASELNGIARNFVL